MTYHSRTAQEKTKREPRTWQLIFLLLVLLGTLLLCSGLVIQGTLRSGPAFIPISMRSTLRANYGPDSHPLPLAPLRMDIVLEAIHDQAPLGKDAAARATNIAKQLQTPVPTVTSIPGQPVARATQTPVSLTPTQAQTRSAPTTTRTLTPTPTPTTLTSGSTINTPVYTATATTVTTPTGTPTLTATPTPTDAPTATPTPSATPTATEIPPPPPPTNTPVPTPLPLDAIDDAVTTGEDTAVTISVLLNDQGGGSASVTAVSVPANGTATTNGTTVTYTPNPNYAGSDTFSYTASNGYQIDTATVHVTVTPVNDTPNAADDSATVDESATVIVLDSGLPSVLGNDTDIEGHNLTAVLFAGPSYASSFTLNGDGTFSYTHDGSETVTDSFDYQVCDDGIPSACANATVVIAILPINDPPSAMDDTATSPEGGTVTALDSGDTSVLYNDVDPEATTLAVDTTPVAAPTNGILVLNSDGSFTYTHDGSETGADSFAYRACDSGAPPLCDTATVDITITPVNDPPAAVDDETIVVQGNTVFTLSVPSDATTVLSNDSDPEGGTLTVNTAPVIAPSYGALTLNADGTFGYTHDGSETTADSFDYQACDDGTPSLCDTATVSITIEPAVPWWDCSYAHRAVITVTAGAVAVPSGYPVSIAFNHVPLVSSARSLSSGDDVRIVYWDGSAWQQRDRVLDAQSAWNAPPSTELWFSLQSAIGALSSDNGYYVYYGNPAAGDPQVEGYADLTDVFAPPADANTLALWYAEEPGASTALVDSSGTGNDGSLYNGTSRTDGRHGTALNLDGTDDYVGVSLPAPLPTTIAVEAWIYMAGQIDEQHIVDMRDATGRYNLRVDGGSDPLRLRWIIRDALGAEHYANAPNSIASSTWYHVAGTWGGGTQALYINGTLVYSHTPTATMVTISNTTDLIIGGISGAPTTANLAGRVDGIRISDVARASFPYAQVTTDPTTQIGDEKARPVPCP